MPYPKSVTIDGKLIDEVHSVNVSIQTPVGPRGDYEGKTNAATVQLLRRARNTPTVLLFKDATNVDGRLKIIKGEIILENSRRDETYTITMDEAYISEWAFNQPEDDDMLYEIVTFKVGAITLKGGGNSKKFKLPDFHKFA
jgi:hypothetical protein